MTGERAWPVPDSEQVQRHHASGHWRTRTALDDIMRHCRETPGEPAVIGSRRGQPDDVELTFGDLDRQSDYAAAVLGRLGVRRRDVVSVQLPNWWQAAALYVAALKLDVVLHPIPPMHGERELGQALGVARSRVLVVPDRFGSRDFGAAARSAARSVADAPDLLFVSPDSPPRPGSAWLTAGDGVPLGGSPAPAPVLVADPDTVTQLMFTSGSTGDPRGVLHTHNTLWSAISGVPRALGLTRADRILVPSTLGHQTGFLYGLSMPLMCGIPAIYQDVWDPGVFADLVERYRVTAISGSATFVMDACDRVERHGGDMRSLRVFRSGGAPIPLPLIARTRDTLGARLLASWGMTENGICTMSRLDDDDQHVAQTDGSPLDGVRLRVTDGGRDPLPPLAEGFLQMTSPSLCVGYLDEMDEFRSKFTEDGWFDTGDRGYLDAEGRLRITGRVKDLIIRGGENVPVADVEAALYHHPDVKLVAVVAVPDDRLGERGCAVVVTKSGRRIDLDELRRHLSSLGMTRQYWPEFVVSASALPMTPAGKIRKNVLRERVRDAEVMRRGAL